LFPKGNILDLTGGMGVDAYFISEQVDSYDLLERQEYLCVVNKHNFKELGRTNIEVKNVDSIQYLDKNESKYAGIYLDPARRNDDETRRVFFLEDFSPNIVELQSKLWDHSDHIIVKLAPMLDINSVVKSLDYVSNIYILSWKNEVKELIVELRKGATSFNRHAINLLGVSLEEEIFSSKNGVKVTLPRSRYLGYIYEPNKAILKAQLQDHVAHHHNLKKMNNNTHFYTSENIVIDFPGRVFKVLKNLPAKEKPFRKEFSGDQANIISRNHPLKSADLHKRFSLRSGGEAYILAFRGMNDKRYILGVERLK
ncbi:hypothetical protein N9B82_03020, partial [Saprospiraceae bacterium]|nr:hypothetical protein [Saprospiraceae bacterium]